MSASLLMIGPAASYELIDQSVNGGTYLSGYSGNTEDLGQPEVDTATIIGQLVDGDRVAGLRSGNRNPNLPILVTGTSSIDLTTKVNQLIQIVDDQQGDGFTLQWTPGGGVPVFIDALRGSWLRQRDPVMEAQFQTIITLNFPALPFTRSTSLTSITVPASGGPAQLQVDGMNSGSFTGASLSTGVKYEGAGSAISGTSLRSAGYPIAIGRAVTSVDLSSYGAASVRFRCPDFLNLAANTAPRLVLSSAGGSATFAGPLFAIPAGSTAWILEMFALANPIATTGTFNQAAVTSWQITSKFPDAAGPSSVNVFLDDLRAYPPGSVGAATAEGAVLAVPAVGGTARTPVALEIDRAGSTFSNALIHSPPVSQDPDAGIWLGLSAGTVTVPAANMTYGVGGQAGSTYAVYGFITANGSGTRTTTVTFTQGSTVVTLSAVTLTGTTNTIVRLGNITLPLVNIPPENTSSSLVITVASTGDTWSDVALCSTAGQTIIATGLGSSKALYVDIPTPVQSLGPIYAATSISRTAASSVLGLNAIPYGGPMQFEPGNNKLLVASTSGALGATAAFYRRWLDEADSL